LEAEAAAAATDYLLAAAAFAGAWALLRAASRRPGRGIRLWAAGFVSLGAAALLGGTWHGFYPEAGDPFGDAVWKATLATAGLAGLFLVSGAAYAFVPRRAAGWITAAAAIKLAVFLPGALASDEFGPVILDSAATLAALLALSLLALRSRRAPNAARWILAGIALSAAAAAVEVLRPDLPRPLTPDAAYHLVQLLALAFFYRGGRLFPD
jgi:uncharacterized protein DUF6962